MIMGRSPCCDVEKDLKKGPWTPEEDQKLIDYIQKNGHGSWRALPRQAGLNRCGKSCRLRWNNYLRPDIKRGNFTPEEEHTIINLHANLGNKWSAIASHLPGRTDNEIKNFWNTRLRKKLLQMGIDPVTHCPRTDHLSILSSELPQLLAAANINHLLNNLIQVLGTQRHRLCDSTLPENQYSVHEFLQTPSQNPAQILSDDVQDFDAVPWKQFDSKIFSNQTDKFGSFSSNSITIKDPNSLPPLILASQELSKPNGIENKLNMNDISNPCSASDYTHQAWCDIMDGEACDSYWKDFIEQESPQHGRLWTDQDT